MSQLAFCSKEFVQNRFSKWQLWWPPWISDLNNFSYFLPTSHPDASYQVSSIGLSDQEKKRKTDFQDDDHLGFLIGTISAIFDLQVTLMLPTKFQINWPFGSGEEVKNRFSRWLQSWISNMNDFNYFDLLVTPMLPTQFQVNWPFGSGEEVKNRFSRRRPSGEEAKNRFSRWQPSQISDWKDFSCFFFVFFLLQVTPMLPTKFQVNSEI